MLFFKKNVDDIGSVDLVQLQKLKDFKESVKSEFLWADYKDVTEFEQQLTSKLQLYINDNWESTITAGKESSDLSIIESLSDFDIERLKNWANGRSTDFSLQQGHTAYCSKRFCFFKEFNIVLVLQLV